MKIMKPNNLRLSLTFILLSLIVFDARSQEMKRQAKTSISEIAPTPPLGYNSYDSYLNFLNEEQAKSLLDIMAKKYKPFGYKYFVIDDGWYDNVEFYKGTKFPKKVLGVSIDKYGLPNSSKMFFPHGIKALADYAHGKGLKFGVWIIRGIPRIAVEKNLPIKGTKYTARDIVDRTSTCSWRNYNYGVDMSKPGAQDYYNSLINKLVSWGVDFVKVDDMVPYPKEIDAISKAIKNSGSKIVFSLSPGDVHFDADLSYYRKANMLRITIDVWDNQASINNGFRAWKRFDGFEGNGFWLDLDMIPFGRLTAVTPDSLEKIIPAEKNSRLSLFSKDQMKTFITQRALAASPLFIGGDLLTMNDYSYSLLTNKDMLACDQNGVMGVNIYSNESVDVWFTSNKNIPGNGWLGIFNRSNLDKKVKLSKYDLGFRKYVSGYHLVENKEAFRLKDIWDNKEFTMDGDHQFSIQANGVVFLKFTEIEESK